MTQLFEMRHRISDLDYVLRTGSAARWHSEGSDREIPVRGATDRTKSVSLRYVQRQKGRSTVYTIGVSSGNVEHTINAFRIS